MSTCPVQAYLYDGYWEDIGTIEAFYNANMGITKKSVPDFRILNAVYSVHGHGFTNIRFLVVVFQTDADKRFLAAKGSVPIGIGRNSHIRRATNWEKCEDS
ncbi:glucose-1-phosphate adenylyltransferase small subunit 2, chloroplastic-like [Cajanus cajan]|uniref:glucose-1-phosphate adenylyltransferase small subunit 2, chloroplastic-like n=1 Tax=Cajanus cajan TaxID=3821 RepID=UPI00098DB550|nr:glucose-1-phosphate adenylyltransferase small subunit 2, chloroplastic-like [Cajanus cajan]